MKEESTEKQTKMKTNLIKEGDSEEEEYITNSIGFMQSMFREVYKLP